MLLACLLAEGAPSSRHHRHARHLSPVAKFAVRLAAANNVSSSYTYWEVCASLVPSSCKHGPRPSPRGGAHSSCASTSDSRVRRDERPTASWARSPTCRPLCRGAS